MLRKSNIIHLYVIEIYCQVRLKISENTKSQKVSGWISSAEENATISENNTDQAPDVLSCQHQTTRVHGIRRSC